MVKILLNNRKPQTEVSSVIYNVLTCKFELEHDHFMSREQFLKEVDFIHPLLTEPSIQKTDVQFHYQYENHNELLRAAIFIYSALMQVDNPRQCTFKINPSPKFKPTSQSKRIYFSTSIHKQAEISISIKEFNGLISHLYGIPFQFSQDIILDTELTVEQLPEHVDADLLYSFMQDIAQLLSSPPSTNGCELRLIDPIVGCGVFARNKFDKGTCLGLYTGIKKHKAYYWNYAFIIGDDVLNTFVDARLFGNLTRFINHAPSAIHATKKGQLANVQATRYCLNGIEFITFETIRTIETGEQLLIDYGEDYFHSLKPILFKPKGNTIGNWRGKVELLVKKTKLMRIMAFYGIKSAQTYLMVRILSILVILLLTMTLLNTLLP
ncbi:SET domain-containing protein-lysine N-methyltransferase [Legionella yabuuchiae]|uniref:SET domain-containing protein-lysine N-methyltransferase n=1 Tax=Legionella yabuuchiae TaxID=376727 RepID=UPI001054B485|nr:SET domain-containing protein-lysine N-methyltransferase [Legionella yabuuchiae]